MANPQDSVFRDIIQLLIRMRYIYKNKSLSKIIIERHKDAAKLFYMLVSILRTLYQFTHLILPTYTPMTGIIVITPTPPTMLTNMVTEAQRT